MTPQFDSPTPFCFGFLRYFSFISYRSKVIRVYLLRWKFGIPVPKFGVFGDLDPKMLFPINATPKKHFLTANRFV
jgi:hypothetical protein